MMPYPGMERGNEWWAAPARFEGQRINLVEKPDFLFTPLRLPFGGKGASGWIIENRDGRLSQRDRRLFTPPSCLGAKPGEDAETSRF